MLATPIATPAVHAAPPAPAPGQGAAPLQATPDDAFSRELDRAKESPENGAETDEARAGSAPQPANPARARARPAAESRPAERPAAKPTTASADAAIEPAWREAKPVASRDAAAPADLPSLLSSLLLNHRPAVATPAGEGRGTEVADSPPPAAAAATQRGDGATPVTAPFDAAAGAPRGVDLPAFAVPTPAINTPTGTPLESPQTAAAVRESHIAAPVGTPAFASGLGAEISLMLRDGLQEARLQLNPAEMGPITVQIQLEGSNARVQMSAELAPTRDALEQALPNLAVALQDHGLTLTGGGVFEQARQPREEVPPARRGDRSASARGDQAPATSAPPGRAAARGVVDLYA